jgi:hypothetical protein
LTIAQLYRARWQVELFFQLDQTAPAHPVFLWHQRERGKDSSLDRPLRLRPSGNSHQCI